MSKIEVEWQDSRRRTGVRHVTILGLPGPEARKAETAKLIELRRELHAKFRSKIEEES